MRENKVMTFLLRGKHFLLKLFGDVVERFGAPCYGRNEGMVVTSNLTMAALLSL